MSLPRRACIIDCETTGLSVQTDRVIEVAATLYDLKIGSPIASFSALARHDSNAAEHINGIPVMLLAEAFEQERVWYGVTELMGYADVILAHNAVFDKSFVETDDGFKQAWDARQDPFEVSPPWVCTLHHVTWPNAAPASSKNLTSLALSYGVAVHAAHRAMTDVDLLSRILTRVKERGIDLQELIGRAMKPRQRVQALVTFDQKDLAKAAGFNWEPIGKRWTREVTAEEVEKGWKFKTRVIG